MRKLLFLTAALGLLSLNLFAQTPRFFKGENGLWGLEDNNGKQILPPKYAKGARFFDGLARVQAATVSNDDDIIAGIGLSTSNNGKYGFIDANGKEVITPKYDYALDFKNGLCPVQLGKFWGMIDKTGKEVIAPKYQSVNTEAENMIMVKNNGKCGYLEKTGKEIIGFKYDSASNFSEGLASVSINKKFGFIDKTGKEVIPFKYDNVTALFVNGIAKVSLNGEFFNIDKTGKKID